MILSPLPRRASRHGLISAINVTPLVDVMLVLLAIFMLTAPLLASGVRVELPETAAQPRESPEDRPLLVSITADREIFVGETPVARDGLVPLLRLRLAREPGQKVYLRGDRHLPYGELMSLMGLLGQAGFRSVSLVVQLRPELP